ncbi:MAG TPA: DUF1631 family protein [Giesbergeria sp.]|nr:DUF1631 family protein [Giesbergeria sp.]HNI75069.1 DUF1631 family protein [Giesbergeria sp.]HNM39107.1 DUF1631 family protein [Giesbergeria sp.]HNN15276.1 DUF1631 family protein [Giesbergeria sp.]
MHASSAPHQPQRRLARQVRERLVEGLCRGQVDIDKVLLEFFSNLMAQTGTQREMQQRRDAWQSFQQHSGDWMRNVAEAWRSALTETPSSQRGSGFNASELSFELVDDDVVENKIVASRIALTVMEAVSAGFESLRLRVQSVEGRELPKDDILRPETVALHLVEQWVKSGMARDDLQTVLDPLQRELAAVLLKVYQACNDLLQSQGVVAQQDLRVRVNRSPAGSGAAPLQNSPASQALAQTQQAMASAREMAVQASRFGASRMAPTSMHPMQQAMPSMYAGASPLARARQRAQGVMVQLKRLLTQPATGFDMVNAPPASAALAHALAAHRVQAESYYGTVGAPIEDYSPAAVVQVTNVVRNRSAEFKKKADSEGEKAIIEVVALMFQSILTEDRIPPAVRIWFARLQVPVLRVALAEPEFFSNMEHPARKLIDRMGSVALGFDSTALSGSALEAEIKRIVQVIEQYPETGRRVFQLVFDEFEAFLAKFLTAKQSTAKLVSVAQQVEQKETLTIQYTIELRTMLKDMPVRDEIREFLFKNWAEVLAMSAVRDGPQHADTVAYKRTAADLVWAASAKPNRTERAQVIQSLPGLLQRLRQGLTLMGMTGQVQDAQIKALTDTLAEAFLSKTAAIPLEHIQALAKRLANLEDFISDADMGDMPLDAESIEMMTGIDASAIHVIADNGAPVEEAMVAWALELPKGNWFTLDHNGASLQVQYSWHSQRKQLHLFAATDGTCYLIQLRRLAAYLQAGLLVAREEEGLTVRATRDALAKLQANPERLLG